MRTPLLLGLIAAAALAVAGCDLRLPTAAAAAATDGTPRTEKRRVPATKDLPCFECHELQRWAEGERFPHQGNSHADLGHCTACHRPGHRDKAAIRTACLECHAAEDLPPERK